jgi:hypothetical protein
VFVRKKVGQNIKPYVKQAQQAEAKLNRKVACKNEDLKNDNIRMITPSPTQ